MGVDMSFNLFDYGYFRLGPLDSRALGERPLLVVLCSLTGGSGPLPVTEHWDKIFGDPKNPQLRNVRDYFLAVPYGKFTWKPAYTSFIQLALNAEALRR